MYSQVSPPSWRLNLIFTGLYKKLVKDCIVGSPNKNKQNDTHKHTQKNPKPKTTHKQKNKHTSYCF